MASGEDRRIKKGIQSGKPGWHSPAGDSGQLSAQIKALKISKLNEYFVKNRIKGNTENISQAFLVPGAENLYFRTNSDTGDPGYVATIRDYMQQDPTTSSIMADRNLDKLYEAFGQLKVSAMRNAQRAHSATFGDILMPSIENLAQKLQSQGDSGAKIAQKLAGFKGYEIKTIQVKLQAIDDSRLLPDAVKGQSLASVPDGFKGKGFFHEIKTANGNPIYQLYVHGSTYAQLAQDNDGDTMFIQVMVPKTESGTFDFKKGGFSALYQKSPQAKRPGGLDILDAAQFNLVDYVKNHQVSVETLLNPSNNPGNQTLGMIFGLDPRGGRGFNPGQQAGMSQGIGAAGSVEEYFSKTIGQYVKLKEGLQDAEAKDQLREIFFQRFDEKQLEKLSPEARRALDLKKSLSGLSAQLRDGSDTGMSTNTLFIKEFYEAVKKVSTDPRLQNMTEAQFSAFIGQQQRQGDFAFGILEGEALKNLKEKSGTPITEYDINDPFRKIIFGHKQYGTIDLASINDLIDSFGSEDEFYRAIQDPIAYAHNKENIFKKAKKRDAEGQRARSNKRPAFDVSKAETPRVGGDVLDRLQKLGLVELNDIDIDTSRLTPEQKQLHKGTVAISFKDISGNRLGIAGNVETVVEGTARSSVNVGLVPTIVTVGMAEDKPYQAVSGKQALKNALNRFVTNKKYEINTGGKAYNMMALGGFTEDVVDEIGNIVSYGVNTENIGKDKNLARMLAVNYLRNPEFATSLDEVKNGLRVSKIAESDVRVETLSQEIRALALDGSDEATAKLEKIIGLASRGSREGSGVFKSAQQIMKEFSEAYGISAVAEIADGKLNLTAKGFSTIDSMVAYAFDGFTTDPEQAALGIADLISQGLNVGLSARGLKLNQDYGFVGTVGFLADPYGNVHGGSFGSQAKRQSKNISQGAQTVGIQGTRAAYVFMGPHEEMMRLPEYANMSAEEIYTQLLNKDSFSPYEAVGESQSTNRNKYPGQGGTFITKEFEDMAFAQTKDFAGPSIEIIDPENYTKEEMKAYGIYFDKRKQKWVKPIIQDMVVGKLVSTDDVKIEGQRLGGAIKSLSGKSVHVVFGAGEIMSKHGTGIEGLVAHAAQNAGLDNEETYSVLQRHFERMSSQVQLHQQGKITEQQLREQYKDSVGEILSAVGLKEEEMTHIDIDGNTTVIKGLVQDAKYTQYISISNEEQILNQSANIGTNSSPFGNYDTNVRAGQLIQAFEDQGVTAEDIAEYEAQHGKGSFDILVTETITETKKSITADSVKAFEDTAKIATKVQERLETLMGFNAPSGRLSGGPSAVNDRQRARAIGALGAASEGQIGGRIADHVLGKASFGMIAAGSVVVAAATAMQGFNRKKKEDEALQRGQGSSMPARKGFF